MERILTNAQMREADVFTIEKLGVSSEELVERAGKAVAEEINRRFMGGRVLVCIGKGNNGADGDVVARILSSYHGFSVSTINICNGIFKHFEKKFDIIVDCIFGTGLNRNVDGKYKTAIELINKSGAFVVSCDIPSGLNGDTGFAMGVAVKANLTIAIQEYKIGHFINDGPDYTGEIIAKDIGISIWGEDFITRISSKTASKYFEKRLRNVNKGNFGKATVVGGSKNFPGSVLLSSNALASLKMGIGYSNLTIPESLVNVYAGINPECTITCMKDCNGQMIFCKEILSSLLNYNAISIGMGIGQSEDVYKIICYLLENYNGNLLIDADGLNVLAVYGKEVLKNAKCNVVLTPHIGEFSRLIDCEKKLVETSCIQLAKDFAKEYCVVLLLKNATSVITDGERVVLNTTGCSGMAKGGSGDVLSGFCAGLLARSIDVFESVCVGAYVFGLAGEKAQNDQNEFTITASDIIKALPFVINSLNE